ncbi:MAG TPA: hypothetical protein VFV67_32595 [Actinophytocola sp.]|uniref:hypothetical protein n=1 Tax=Actinophytocola sp. TaxID=1872138 RepID=UPI002DB57732|nr:hypothetical protein [Actinophytocola sp.]HEU5475408.1 hypothetical protein [Actinophytocola sp.]
MTAPASRAGVRALVTASATVTLATVVVNLASYGLIATGTRVLGPDHYGELAALLGLVFVGSVPAVTLQVVLARRVAAGERGGLGRAAVLTAVVVGAVAAATVPVLSLVLHISLPALVFLVVALPAVTLAGAPTGAVQGLHLFGRLATLIVIAGVGRIGGGLAGLLAGGTAAAAMAGVAIGSWLALLAAAAAVRGPGRTVLAAPGEGRGPLGEIGYAALTMLGFAAISTADVLLAHRYLPAEQAGLYGAGAIVTKAALWLPAAVTMIALPRLAVPTQRRAALRVSALALAGIGVLEVAGILLLGPFLFPLAVGEEYRPVIDWLWLFALAGAVLAITQLVVMYRVAGTDRVVPVLLWTALTAEVIVVAFRHDTIGTIVIVATATAALVVLAGLLLPVRSRKTTEDPPVLGQFGVGL